MQAVGYWDMSLLQLILLKFDWTTRWLTWHMWLALFARLGSAISSQKPLRHTTVESQACQECRCTMPYPCPNKRRFRVSAKYPLRYLNTVIHSGLQLQRSLFAYRSPTQVHSENAPPLQLVSIPMSSLGLTRVPPEALMMKNNTAGNKNSNGSSNLSRRPALQICSLRGR